MRTKREISRVNGKVLLFVNGEGNYACDTASDEAT
jgi:hypothetical protein